MSSSCYGSVYTNTHSLHQCTFSEHTVTHTHTHAIKLYKCACQHKCVKGQLIDRTTGMQMHGPACTHTYRAHNIGNYSSIRTDRYTHPPTHTHRNVIHKYNPPAEPNDACCRHTHLHQAHCLKYSTSIWSARMAAQSLSLKKLFPRDTMK